MTKSLAAAAFVASTVLSACGGATATQSNASMAATASKVSQSGHALSCSLPVVGSSGQGVGFLSIPSGTFKADARVGSPDSATYDWAYRRWLPVGSAQVLPDGSAYAYTRGAQGQLRNEIHLVDVATGTDRLVYSQGAYQVVAYRPDGIYLDHHLSGTDGSNGLWRLDPTTGSLTPYAAAANGTWSWIGAGAAWSYSLDGSRFGSNSFARLDLATGAIQTWFHVDSPPPGDSGFKSIRFLGLDGSSPLVQVYNGENTSEIWRISGPGQATRLHDLPLGVLTPPTAVKDAHGTWLITPDGGVYLYSHSAFTRVASAPAGANSWYAVAGACS